MVSWSDTHMWRGEEQEVLESVSAIHTGMLASHAILMIYRFKTHTVPSLMAGAQCTLKPVKYYL